MQIFDPIARGNDADTANCCQVMIYSHVEKDLNRNENFELNLEQNTSLTAACFPKMTFTSPETSYKLNLSDWLIGNLYW